MIKKEAIAQIILDFQRASLPQLVRRELKIDLNIPLKRAITIVGPRRSGKTYYLYSLMETLIASGISRQRILYLNFEDLKFVGMDAAELEMAVEVFYEIYPQNRKDKVWFFFDEIQNVENWNVFIRNMLDKQNASVFLTGSSSKLLSQEIATALRGRTLTYLILPFSFSEYLSLNKISYGKYISTEERSKILHALREYFTFGGYPETIIYPKERQKIINEMIDVTIYRDIIERHKIRNTKLVKIMFNALVEAKEFSVHKFFNFIKSLNIKVSKDSLYNYLEYFNDAYILFPLRKFSWSLKNIEQSIPKMYCIDNALIEKITGNNKGKKLENLVFLSFLRKGYEPNKDFFYYSWESGEIDFILKNGKKICQLIQVCYDVENFKTKEREVKALIKASCDLKCLQLHIVTWDYEGIEESNGRIIKFIPLVKWLLLYPG